MDDKKVNKLTAKQERFCQEYINCLNGTEAAIKAGYSAKTAQEISAQNLSKLIIINRLKELQKPVADSLNISRERIARNILKIAEPEHKEIDLENGIYPTKESDILKANELLAKMFGFNEPDKLDLTTKGESMRQLPPIIVQNKEDVEKIISELKWISFWVFMVWISRMR
jgi:phage terminase small subunit